MICVRDKSATLSQSRRNGIWALRDGNFHFGHTSAIVFRVRVAFNPLALVRSGMTIL